MRPYAYFEKYMWGQLVEADGVASVELTRNVKNELETCTRLDLNKDPVELYKQLNKTSIVVDDYGQLTLIKLA